MNISKIECSKLNFWCPSSPNAISLPPAVFPASVNGNSSFYLLSSNTLESSFFSLSHNPRPIPLQILLAVLSKYMQNRTTSRHLHCCHPGLSTYHLLPGSLQMPANWPHSYSCPIHPILNTIALLTQNKAKVLTVAHKALQNPHTLTLCSHLLPLSHHLFCCSHPGLSFFNWVRHASLWSFCTVPLPR